MRVVSSNTLKLLFYDFLTKDTSSQKGGPIAQWLARSNIRMRNRTPSLRRANQCAIGPPF
jgi:hypothetical protein